MTRSYRGGFAVVLLVLAALTPACLDSVVRTLAPENDPQVENTPAEFHFVASDLQNVTDQASWVWTNPDSQAAFQHQSFIHHGYGIVMIRDGAGTLVDSTLLQFELESETRRGAPGDWTIILTLAGARGRAEFTLTPKP